MQGCGNVTKWSWIVNILHSSQSWRNVGATSQYRHWEDVVNLTLLLQRCIDITISTSIICCEINLLYKVKAALVTCEFDVVVLTFWIWRCDFDIVNTTFIVLSESNLLRNVEIMLEQRFNFNVVTTLLQRCALVVRLCDLTTRLSQHYVFVGWPYIGSRTHLVQRICCWSSEFCFCGCIVLLFFHVTCFIKQ